MSMDLDITTTMILVKGEDKTENISWLDNARKNQWIEVQYKGNFTIYKYSSQNIVILRKPKSIALEHCLVSIKGVPAYKVSKVLNFGIRYRIIYENGKCETVLLQDISFIKNQAKQSCISQILNYLKEISQYTSDSEHEEAYLKTELDQLTFVNSDSALYYYLKGNQSKIKSVDINKIIFPFCYNLSQKTALETSLTNVISVIDGPPGTGKTQTILNLIANLVTVYGKSVAVVSGNNEAIKNVIEKMQKNNYGFIMAMLGNNKNQKQFFNNMPQLNIGNWNCIETQENLHQKINALNTKLNHLLEIDRSRACLENELQQWEIEQAYFEEYFKQQNIEQIIKLPLFWATPERILSFLAETYLAEETQKSKGLIFKIKLFIKYGIKDYSKLCEEETLLFLSLQKEFYVRQISRLREHRDSLQSKLENVSFESLLEEHQILSERLFQKYLYMHYHQTKKTGYTISNYKAKFAEFIKTYPVILSTTHSLRRSLPENYLLDYVIIDEASQVDLITGVLALSCCRNVVIVGDVKQLPQITDSEIEKQIKTCLTNNVYNYFQHNILSSVIELYGNKLERTILREHYRCHPIIIGYCNQKYYNDELIPFTNRELSPVPMLIYETAEGNHMRKVTRGNTKGNYNQRELDVTIEEVINDNGSTDKYEHIGFVTPFRLQADKAGELLNKQIESDTVHKYQGREKEVMIMSTVLDNTRSGHMGKQFVDDPRLVNVAVSRAIKQFILVTNRELFLKKRSEIGDLIRYIEYSNPENNVVKSNIVSVFDLLYKNYSNRLIPLKRRMNSNARFKSQEIIRVLLDKVFNEEQYDLCFYAEEMLLRNLIRDISKLNKEELQYVNNRASLDFVIYRKIGKSCVLAIEVDGFEYHENNPKQLNRDRLKNSILEKYKIPLLRLPTNHSGEEEKLKKKLDELL
jgi:superfamily I DNA and/or RNA helicase